eukprot:6880185-Pyramimonas_sp.AAC.1
MESAPPQYFGHRGPPAMRCQSVRQVATAVDAHHNSLMAQEPQPQQDAVDPGQPCRLTGGQLERGMSWQRPGSRIRTATHSKDN